MKLQAKTRDLLGKKVKNLRKSGVVPASIYGPSSKNKNIEINESEFKKLFNKVGFNKFFDLEIEGEKPVKVLVKEVQIHPVKDYFISVNFYQVDENKKITVDVPIELIGESPAVKLNLGFLVQQLETISLYCLPKDVPSIFQVDISTLANVSDSIPVSELKLEEGVELSSDVDSTTAIAYIATAQKEVETTETTEGAEAEGTTTPEAQSETENKAE